MYLFGFPKRFGIMGFDFSEEEVVQDFFFFFFLNSRPFKMINYCKMEYMLFTFLHFL